MTRIPDLIRWHQGMLLSPQHFQQLAMRSETLIQTLPMLYVPYWWGVRDWDYDILQLPEGKLSITKMEAVTPDGLFLEITPDNPVELDLRPFAEQMRNKPTRVHVAVPVPCTSSGGVRRLVPHEGFPVADENDGDARISVPRLRPAITLIASDLTPARYTSFPLIEICHQGERFEATDYVPPSLQARASSPLGKICSKVAVLLRNKATILRDKLRSRPASSSAAEERHTITMLTAGLPGLESLIRSDTAHPFALYLALCQVAGQVAVLGDELLPRQFPAYVHNDPKVSYEAVSAFILKSVQEGVPDRLQRFEFVREEGIYRLAADPAWTSGIYADRPPRLALAIEMSANMYPAQAESWGAASVIGSRSAMESLLERRVLGLERRSVEIVGELGPLPGTALFELKSDTEILNTDEDLIIAGPAGGPQPRGVCLYLVQQDERSAKA